MNSTPASGMTHTTAPVEHGCSAGTLPEFGRFPDVTRLFGLRKYIVYQLIASGDIRSVVLRRKGARTGMRLIHLESVRSFLYKEMDQQAAQDHRRTIAELTAAQ